MQKRSMNLLVQKATHKLLVKLAQGLFQFCVSFFTLRIESIFALLLALFRINWPQRTPNFPVHVLPKEVSCINIERGTKKKLKMKKRPKLKQSSSN